MVDVQAVPWRTGTGGGQAVQSPGGIVSSQCHSPEAVPWHAVVDVQAVPWRTGDVGGQAVQSPGGMVSGQSQFFRTCSLTCSGGRTRCPWHAEVDVPAVHFSAEVDVPMVEETIVEEPLEEEKRGTTLIPPQPLLRSGCGKL